MRKVVWTSLLAGLAIAFLSVGDAAAQARPKAKRQRLQARVEKRLDQRFQKLDQNHDGGISKDEWRRNARVFDRFDANHDGVLSADEYRRMAKAVGARRLTAKRAIRRR